MKPLIVAHKGANLCTLNCSLKSLEYAKKVGVDIIELDVYMTKDTEFIINKSPYIKNNYIWEISARKFKSKFLLLEEVLNWGSNTNSQLMIDIKSFPSYQQYNLEAFLDFLDLYFEYQKYLWIISFDHKIIHEIKYKNKSLRCGILFVANFYDVNLLFKNLEFDLISTQNRFLTKKLADTMHRKGIKICSWTTDNLNEISHLLDLNVEMINTNNPKIVKRYLSSKRKHSYRDQTRKRF